MMACAGALSGCVNGKVEKGTPLNVSSVEPTDTVSTLTPGGEEFHVIEGMGTCSFANIFDARVENGVVKCLFHNFDEEMFKSTMAKHCTDEEFVVENIDGRCCGIKCIVEGGGIDPVLFMIADDGHAERVSLYNLSSGARKASQRSLQTGIVDFVTEYVEDENSDYEIVVGMMVDSTRVQLRWLDKLAE